MISTSSDQTKVKREVTVGGDPERIRKAQRDRFKDDKVVDEILAIDEEWRKRNQFFDEKSGIKLIKPTRDGMLFRTSSRRK